MVLSCHGNLSTAQEMFRFWLMFNFLSFIAQILNISTNKWTTAGRSNRNRVCVCTMFFPTEVQWAVSMAPRPQTPSSARCWTRSWIEPDQTHTQNPRPISAPAPLLQKKIKNHLSVSFNLMFSLQYLFFFQQQIWLPVGSNNATNSPYKPMFWEFSRKQYQCLQIILKKLLAEKK